MLEKVVVYRRVDIKASYAGIDATLLQPRPVVKWVGGKRQLVNGLKGLLPPHYKRFFEPFVGGGALTFALRPEQPYISDLNGELINLYTVIRDDVKSLIEHLYWDDLIYKINPSNEDYYRMRNLDRAPDFASRSPVSRAARFILVNKTCFNGLYRVNTEGHCNAAFGYYSNPTILDAHNLLACSKALRNAVIRHTDFSEVVNHAHKGDLVYFDPPYVPVSPTASFTSYTKGGFGEEKQHKLRRVCDQLDKNGVYWMLSNSHTDFIMNLYKDYYIHVVQASRAINCKAAGRGKVKEVVVTNYNVSTGGLT